MAGAGAGGVRAAGLVARRWPRREAFVKPTAMLAKPSIGGMAQQPRVPDASTLGRSAGGGGGGGVNPAVSQ
eukprot:COSAG06_NODE_4066_length_4609_cov_4.807761_4_plen_71_part_00